MLSERRTMYLALLALVALLTWAGQPALAQLSAAGAADISARDTTPLQRSAPVWKVANTCCLNCNYDSSCCCAPRGAARQTLTQSKIAYKSGTKTTTVLQTKIVATRILTKLVSAKRSSAGQRAAAAPEEPANNEDIWSETSPDARPTATPTPEPVSLWVEELGPEVIEEAAPAFSDRDVDQQDPATSDLPTNNSDEIDANDQEGRRLFARHLCPVCPSGVSVLPAGSAAAVARHFNGQPGVSYCCKPRAVKTKTVHSTHTKYKIVTRIGVVRQTYTSTFTSTIGAKQTVVGRLYIDKNRNKKFDIKGPDVALSDVEVFVSQPDFSGNPLAPKRFLARAKTDKLGVYKLVMAVLPPSTPVNLVQDSPDNEPFATLTVTKEGTVNPAAAPMPDAVPVKLRYRFKVLTGRYNDSTTVFGDNANKLARVRLYADEELVNTNRSDSSGNFVLVFNRNVTTVSGWRKLKVTQLDDLGIESDLTDAEDVFLPDMPTTTTATATATDAPPAEATTTEPAVEPTNGPAETTTEAEPTMTPTIFATETETTTTTEEPTTTTMPPLAQPTIAFCGAGTAYAYIPGKPRAPSSRSKWAIKAGPVGSGNHNGYLVYNASSFVNGGTGACNSANPGSGGPCGDLVATMDIQVNRNRLSVTYKPSRGVSIRSAHVNSYCTEPMGDEDPSTFPMAQDFPGNGTKTRFSLTSGGSFTNCPNGWWFLIEANVSFCPPPLETSTTETTQTTATVTTRTPTTSATKTPVSTIAPSVGGQVCPSGVSGTAFGWINGTVFQPSQDTRWAIVPGPLPTGTYTATLVGGASSFKSNGNGGCASPGRGGGCGTKVGQVAVTLTGSGITAAYSMWSGGLMTNLHVYWSCTRPVGSEAPGSYPIVNSFSGSGVASYTAQSSGSFPTCNGGYYLMLHASFACSGSSPSPPPPPPPPASPVTTKTATKSKTATNVQVGGAGATTTKSKTKTKTSTAVATNAPAGGASGTCPSGVAGTAFGWINGTVFQPSQDTRWAIVPGPLSPGNYVATLVGGASSFKDNGNGGCASPGLGGGCGTKVGTVSVTLTTSGISAVYNMYTGGSITNLHVYWSCTRPVGSEAPGSYPIVFSFSGSGVSTYSTASSGSFPTCGGGYYLMLHASFSC